MATSGERQDVSTGDIRCDRPPMSGNHVKLVHSHTVEGLYWRALAGKVPSALKEELKTLGLDLDAKPRDIEQAKWAQVLGVTVRHLYPRLSTDDGYYRLGETIVQGYE